jgi:hypothetical protein
MDLIKRSDFHRLKGWLACSKHRFGVFPVVESIAKEWNIYSLMSMAMGFRVY